MKTKIISLLLFCVLVTPLYSQTVEKPQGSIVNHLPKTGDKFIGSPGLAILPNGDYVASHDEFGPKSTEFRSAVTHIFLSHDKGATWERIASLNGQFWSNLFVHNGDLYLMGTNKHHGNLIIRKSTGNGYTWSIPYRKECGLILEGEYHTAPMPMLYHNGRIWRTVEYATAATTAWGKRYSAMMVSAPTDADLLHADSWTRSNALPYDSTYLNGAFEAWLEGNAVATPDGNVVDILRVGLPAGHEEMAAIVEIGNGGRTASFNPANGFIRFPGGAKKFSIRYDEKSKRYWTLVNYIKPEFKDQTPSKIRNTLSLCSSPDLHTWTLHTHLLEHPDAVYHGFQYVEWLFDGKDLIYLVRTSFDDEEGGARNNHDANFLVFHRLEKFRKWTKKELHL